MRRIPILFALTLLLFSCNKKNNDNCEELLKINSGVIRHYNVIELKFSNQRNITPKRYLSNYNLYNEFKDIQTQLVIGVDSLIEENNYTINVYQINVFNKLKIMIDNIYLPQLDTVKSGWLNEKTNSWNYETRTQKTNIDEFIIPLEKRILNCETKCDLLFIKLYLSLIDRETISFLYKKADEMSMPINFIKPMTIEKGNKVICYISAIDTCNFPIIYIGKFNQLESVDYPYYQATEIVKKIEFKQENVEIDINLFKKNEVLLEYTHPQGFKMHYKIK